MTNPKDKLNGSESLKPLRILYAACPGDIIGTFQKWQNGKEDPNEFAATYSGQFYNVCKKYGLIARVISRSKKKGELITDNFHLENRPALFDSHRKILYHLGLICYGLGLLATAIRFRSNLAIITEGTTHWFVLSLFSIFGIKVIPSIHCRLCPRFVTPSSIQKMVIKSSRSFFSKRALAAIVVSDEIGDEIKELTGPIHCPIFRCFPVASRSLFEKIREPDEKRSPFRVLFLGRIEVVKGVFDLLKMAVELKSKSNNEFYFDLCGDGSSLEDLRKAVLKEGVEGQFFCHGHTRKEQVIEFLNRSHVVIVPTQTYFAEGFNKVSFEGIMAGRPVITSPVCPDIHLLSKGVIEVRPNNVNDYVDALIRLSEDREFYELKRNGSLELREEFFDHQNTWGNSLETILVRNFSQ